MNTIGEITFEVKGSIGDIPITPDNYDIFNLPQIIEDVRAMLFPNGKDKASPVVTYEMRRGSVVHVFKTQMQKVVEFGAVLSMVNTTSSLDGLVANTAHAFEDMQMLSRKQGLTFNIFTSVEPLTVTISPETNYVQSPQPWVDAEFYFYGRLIDAGGKEKANIHLATEDYGTLRIAVEKDYLRNIEGNPLYRDFAIRAKGKQNACNGEIDTTSLKLIEITDYDNQFDDEYINSLIQRATPTLKEMDADEWLREMRREVEYA